MPQSTYHKYAVIYYGCLQKICGRKTKQFVAFGLLLLASAFTTPASAQTTIVDICSRTAQVEAAILAAITATNDCTAVTTGQLAGITGTLNLSGAGISALQAGDFAGLSSVTALHLFNNSISTLSAGVFTGLTSLTELSLISNDLTMLPAGVFNNLADMEFLFLNDNSLSTLSAGVFTGLTSLTSLTLHENALTALPAGLFSGLGSLATLRLHDNTFTTRLPANLFDPLPSDAVIEIDLSPIGDLADISSLTPLGTTMIDVTDGFISKDADGNDRALTYTVTPVNLAVATASERFIEGVAAGTTDVTITAADGVSGTATQTISVTVVDAGIFAYDASDIGTVTIANENGGTAMFYVELLSAPAGAVVMSVMSSDTNEGTVTPPTLMFTSTNWNVRQPVTVTAVDDSALDDDRFIVNFMITTSDGVGGNYPTSLILQRVTVTVTDDDDAAPVAGLAFFDAATGSTMVTSITTGEPNVAATFYVELTSAPTADVTVAITSDDPGEGTPTTNTGASLTFTSTDWNVRQQVIVTGANDNLVDGDQPYTVTLSSTSTDTDYNGLTETLSAVNTDDDATGLVFFDAATLGNLITAPHEAPLITTEPNVAATFYVQLKSAPTATVTVAVTSEDTSEGIITTGASLTFTTGNWNVRQQVIVTGVDDNILLDDGYIITVSSTSGDPNYNGLTETLSAINTDDDAGTAGLAFFDAATGRTEVISITTGEPDVAVTFYVRLTSEPTADVTVAVTSDDTSEGIITTGASLTFTTGNWNMRQPVTVTGANDNLVDGDQPYTVTLNPASATDTDYNALVDRIVTATNTDDDAVGIALFEEADSATGSTQVTAITTGEPNVAATFYVELTSAPTANVTVAVTSDDTTEGTITTGASLTFTTGNWNMRQEVTVTGANDDLIDGDQSYTVTLNPASATDTNYNALVDTTVDATNTDDDVAPAGLALFEEATSAMGSTMVTAITTGEPNVAATFYVELTSAPTANVTVAVTSDDTSEGTITTGASLTFTIGNWNMRQEVTVTGANDGLVDGDQTYTVTLDPTSTDTAYNALADTTVAATNTDDDAPPAAALALFEEATSATGSTVVTVITTSEAGDEAAFYVELTSAPTANVTVAVTSDDTTEGTITTGASLTFTTGNWNMRQAVIVTGADDGLVDGDQSYTVTLTSTSTDTAYNALADTTVAATNTDDDTAGLALFEEATSAMGSTQVTSITTGEPDVATTFYVRLTSEPTADVTVAVTSDDTSEGIITTGASLTFTTGNWNMRQEVTVTGANDDLIDGDQTYTVTLNPASATDTDYNALPNTPVAATNSDDDTAGLALFEEATSAMGSTMVTAITTGEPNVAATFYVELTSAPTANVTVAVTSDDTTEGTITTGASLTFTTGNWNMRQEVTVTGQDDSDVDGDQSYTVTLNPESADTNYNALPNTTVAATNTDDDVAVAAALALFEEADSAMGSTQVTAITTGEPNVATTFYVQLTSAPTANVTVAVTSDDTTEGTITTGTSLTFTTGNWNMRQAVIVTGQDDSDVDGDQSYTVTLNPTSTDSAYGALTNTTVAATNTDDDVAVAAALALFEEATSAMGSTVVTSITTGEPNVAATFYVELTSAPTANVTVAVTSDDTSEGIITTGASLTFTTGNWNIRQAVTVTGANDGLVDGDQSYTVTLNPASATDTAYNGLPDTTVAATNTDNEVAGLALFEEAALAIGSTQVTSITTGEPNVAATFYVELTSAPTATVTVAVTSGDTTEGTITTGASLTFTTGNWFMRQEVIVTGANDDLIDGDQTYTVTLNPTSTDSDYNALPNTPVTATNIDDDMAGLALFEEVNSATGSTQVTAITTGEPNVAATFYVQLTSAPTANVTVAVTSDDATEGTITTGASLTFTTGNWNIRQAVIVTGANDNLADGDQSYTITLNPASATDTNYNGLADTTVAATNIDDETAGIVLFSTASGSTQVTAITTGEPNVATTFYVELTSAPTADVTVAVTSDDTSEGTITTGASLTFTTGNWNMRQAVTVTGANDNLVDGDQSYTVTLNPASSDTDYNGLADTTVAATNTDDDVAPGLALFEEAALAIGSTQVTSITTGEPNVPATFYVELTSAPTANVTVAVTSDDTSEGIITTGASLTFTTGNWNIRQAVTVTGANDGLVDGDQSYTVTLNPTSTDTAYNGLADTTVAATNTDNEVAGLALFEEAALAIGSTQVTSITTGEPNVAATFYVELTSQPTDTVTVAVTSGDTTEGTITTGASLTFTTGNWFMRQEVIVTGANDDLIDGDQSYTVTLNPTSTDTDYNALPNTPVTATNIDDETAGIALFEEVNSATGSTQVTAITTGEPDVPATFYVQLTSVPTANVTVAVTSDDATEGTITTGASLTFTTGNWNMRQAVTVTGANDNLIDGDQSYTITLNPASSDSTYGALTNTTVTATNSDDDTAGIALFEEADSAMGSTQVTAITTGEPNVATTFYVQLTSAPTANVTVAVTSDDTTEGTITTGASLTFTTGNWNIRQAVTVTGANDNLIDGDQTYTVTLNPASSDSDYNGLADTTVDATNSDNDTAELTIADMSVDENAGTATVTVTLSVMVATGDVMVDLTTADGTATAGEDYTAITSQTLTFAVGETSQTLDITINDDLVDEGDSETFTVMLDNLVAPTGVTIATADTATVTITDDDTASTTINLSVNPSTVAETAGATTITVTATLDGTVVLSTATDIAVTVGGGTATVTTDYIAIPDFTLTIPALSLSATQTFMITPVDDTTAEGEETVIISGTSGSFTVNPATLTILEAGISVFDMASGGTLTNIVTIANENSGTMTFYVQLVSAPASDVTLTLTSSDTNEGTVMPGTLTFTATPGATSWDSRQAVTVTAVDDNVDRDDSFMVDFAVTTGDSGNYPTTLNLSSVTVTVTDDDTVGIALFDAATGTDAPSITTTEGATTDSFYVALESEPTGTVTVTISGLVATEHTLDPVAGTLTFTPTGATAWNTRQEITLTGVDDNVVDGDQMYDITLTPTGGGYGSVTAPTVSITNTDDDTAAISIADLTIDENAGTATLTVTLTPAVTAGNVTVDLTTMDGTATAGEDYTAFTSETLIITEGSTTQTLDIPINNDNIDETDETFTVTLDNLMLPAAVTGDVTITDATATVTITDDDTVGIALFDAATGTDAPSITTTEGATTDSFYVALESEPTGTVTVTISGLVATEHTLDPVAGTLTFTPTGATAWNTRQAITLTGVDDNVVDGDQTYDLTLTPTGGGYDSVTAPTVSVTNEDNDTAELTIADMSVDENAGTATVTVTLSVMVATGDVMVDLTTADGTATAGEDYTAITSQTLTFAVGETSQTLDITINDDLVDEGDSETFTVMLDNLVAPTGVTIATADTATVTITDDDTASTTINLSVNPSTVAETAGATTITVTATLDGTVVLSTATDIAVTVGGGTATVTTDYIAIPDFTLTIPALSLSATQTFMITPVDDTTAEGEETVIISGTSGSFTVNPATLTILEAGISVFDMASGGTLTNIVTIANENSGTMTFYVQLVSAPASDVTLTLTSSDTNEGTVMPGTLTFTATPGATSWDSRQAVTVTAVDDNVDRDDSFMVDFAVTTGDSGNYPTTLNLSSVTVTVTDDDTVGIALFDAATGTDAPSITTTEGATTDSFYVALESEPTGTVTVTISGLVATEHTLDPVAGTLTFTPTGATAWNTRQEITLTGVDDNVVDGDQMYDITLTPTGGGYGSVTAPTVSITNTDDDTAAISIADLTIDENAGTATLTVTLTPAVTAGNVTVDLTTMDGTATAGEDYTAFTSETLIITEGSTTQTLDIPINNDNIDETDETFTVTLDNLMLPAAVTGDVTITDATATITITDDDTLSNTINLSVSPLTVAEIADATTITVTATIDGTAVSTMPTTVTVSVGGGTATSGTDYTAVSDFTLTIPAESASGMATFMIDPTDDTADDNNETVMITGTATGFTTINPATLTIVEAGISVHDAMTLGNPISTITIVEASGTGMLYVQLASQPAGNVTLSVTSDDTNEGTVTPPTLTFSDTNWDTRQLITVTAVDDNVDRDDSFMVDFAVTTGDSGNYTSSLTLPSVTVTITDDDTLSNTINLSVSPLSVAETADATTITVTATIDGTAVSTMPTTVTVSVGGGTATSGTDYTAVSDFTLTIPAESASGMATFMIDPTDDTADDNNETVMITGTAGGFTTINPATLTIVEAGISVHDAMTAGSQISTITIVEASGTGMLYVQLASQPAGNVTLSVTSDDTNEGTVTPPTLTFTATPGATSWDSRQAVTVTAVDDNVDRDDSFMVDFAVTTGDSGNYTSSLTLPSVTVTVTDDDTVGIALFDAATGTDAPSITTTEGATTDSFYVALESEPTGTVTVTISGLVATEHTLDPVAGTLTFTPTGATAWNTRQEITLTGVDDNVVDGDQMYDLTLTPTGGGYDSVTAPTVSVTNEDNDTAELTIADMSVDENAGTATVTVTLSVMVATGDVMVDLTTADGTATAGEDYTAITSQTLTFAVGETSQTLDITINDDLVDEGDSETFTVMLDNLVAPTGVTIATADTATVTITDDDTASTTINLSVNPSTVAETAGATTITVTATLDGTVVLSTATDIAVTVGGGTATVTTDYIAIPDFTLTIPALSLSATQTFMITPVDDTTAEGEETVIISGTSGSFTVNPATLTILEAGISVFDMASGGTLTNIVTIANENSGTMTFYVQLVSAPASDVTLTLTSSDTNEGTVMPGTLTFTATPGATSWDSRQAVTVTAVDDNVDRDDSFMVDFAVTTGDSGNYPTTLNLSSVTVTVTDDDTVGIALFDAATGTDAPSITTTEGATTDSFYVALESEPTGTVTVTISGLVATEHTLDPVAGTLTFTPTGATAWNTRQEITLTGVDDNVVDGDQMYDITLTPTGGGYGSVTAPTVSITNTDDDTAAISIADLTIDENAGTATLTVTLTPAVTAGNVTVDLTTMDGTATAGEDYTAFTSETLIITEGSTTQTLDIPINNDNIDETDETFTVTLDNLMLPAAVTGDVTITDATATITITDDDTLSNTINLSVSPLTVAEIADATTITVTATIDGTAVSTMPTTVTVSVGGGTATSGTDYTAVSDFTLTIPAESASGMATFMIDPTDDTTDDNNETVMITGTAGGFTTINPATLTIVEAGISVHDAMTLGNPISTITIVEASGTGMLYVQLASQPAGNVTLSVTSDDTNEGTVTPPTLTFSDTNWDTRQLITVTAVDDNVDRDDSFMVDFAVTTGDSGNYTSSLTLPSVTVTITDDDTLSDTINLSVSPLSVAETADATTITVTATLGSAVVLPTETIVTVSVGGGTATSGTDYTAVSDFTLTIPAESASGMATFMIDPTDDTADDNNETVMITGTAGGFTTINPATLTIVEAGISVHDAMTAGSQISTITIVEASGTGMLYVQLASEPAGNVTLSVTSDDTNEGTVTPPTLTFSDTNWDTRQLITVTAVDDNVDRDDSFMVDFAVTTGDSGNYTSSLTLPSVTVTITDDDTLSDTINLSVSPLSVAETADATTITVTATLGSAVVLPTETIVTVSVGGGTATSGTDYTAVSDFTLTIPAESASGMATFMIDPTDDTADDNNETVMITGTAGGFTTINPATLTIVEAGISVHDAMTAGSQISTITIVEASGTGMLYVQLASQPAGNVTLSVTSDDTNEGTVTPPTLTFSDTNWDTRQLITVTAVDDNVDRDDSFMVDFAVTTGDSGNYTSSLTLPSVTVTITDDDTLSNTINLSVSPLTVAEIADATTITVTATIDGTAVSTMPTTVTVSVGGGTATSGTDYTAVSDFTLTIPAESASGMATFMIDPTDDTADDNNETVMITGTATGFTTINPATLTIVEAGISVHDAMTLGNPISTITIVEASGTGMLYVQLASQPAGNVTLSVTSDDTNEGTVTPPTLTFSDTNWDTRQLITVTAVDDNVDRDDSFMVDFAVTTGDSGNYTSSLTLPSVTVTITDDDTLSDTINLSVSPLSVAETADATTITVTATIDGTAVSTMPTTVTVSVGGGTATSGTDYTAVSDFTLTIPAESASGMATFMIDPTDDTADDNNETVMITGTAGGFTTINPATLTIVEAGISVHDAMTAGSQISTITIVEASGTDMLYVQLASQPAGNVTLSVTSDDTNEGTVSTPTLTFSDTNWDTRQLITVTAVDDNVDRDDSFMVDFAVTTGDSGNYTSSLTLPSVTVTITDDDTLSDTINLSVSPLSVAETADATTITVTATLGSAVVLPTETIVTVSVGGGTATSGTDYTAVSDFTLTIPAESASGMATFMIDPTDDTTDDNNETVMITGTAGGFTTINPATLTIVEAGISVHDAMTAGSQISTITIVEASGTGMLYVQLASQPAGNVTLSVTSDDTNEGTVTPPTLTFSDTNWDTRQLITVTAVDDNVDRDDSFMVDFAVTTGDSGNYTSSLTLPSVTVTITDDDTLSDTINLSVSPLSVAETADATTITVTATLGSAVVLPTETIVTVSVGDSSDSTSATEGTDYATIADFPLTIPALSSSGMATFMITPVDDGPGDNNETVTIDGAATINGTAATVTATTLTIVEAEAGISVFDDMTAGTEITTATIANENSGTDILYVQLASQPAGNVTLSVTSDDTNEGTVSTPTLTFSDTNWDTRQLITVTAVDDSVDRDGDSFMVDFAVTTGDSANYTSSLTLPSVTVTITDDDTVSNTINLSVSPLSVAEIADATTITVTATIDGTAVSTMPTTVTVSVGGGTATSGTDYAAVTDFTLTIPAESASGMATFMIDPTDDTADDNNETVMITGTATGFTTINPATLTIVEAGISVHDAMTLGNPISTITIVEASGTGMLYVQLASEPAGNVTLSVTSDDTNEGTVSTPTLTFSDTNWDTRQLITVTAVDDNVDRDDSFMVDFAVTTGDSGNYTSSLTLPSVTVTITDDDTLSDTINLSVSPLSVAETADATTITVTATLGSAVVLPTETTVTVSVGGGTATSGTDYTAVSDFTLTIPAESASGMATFMIDPTDDTADDNNETVMITGTATGFTTINPATLTIVEGLNTEQRDILHGQLLGVANQATMQVIVDVLSQRLKPRARTEAHGSVAGHVLGLGEWQDADWQKRLSLVVYSTLQRLDEGGALLVPVDATTFDNSEFVLPLEVGESVVVLWGALGSSTVSGGQSDASDYDGDLIAVLLGIDSMIGEHARLGVAASYEHSELDYQLDMTSGDAVQTMTGIQPYLSWQPHDSVALWLMGGYGFGDYDATESTAGGTTLRAEDADVERWMAALGFHYVHRFGSSGWDMVLNNKALWNRTVRDEARFDDGSLLPRNISANWRARLESEVGYSWTFGDGSLRPYGLASVRWDGGDVVNDDTTFMVDAGGGVELSFASRLSMDFKVRRQVTDGDHEENNVVAVGSFGFAEHEDGQGWQVALERSLLGGLRAPEHNKAGFDFEQGDSTPTIGQSPSLQANVGYGRLINPLTDAKAGLLKTYTRFYLDPDENKRHALGLGFDFASLQVGVESEYNNGELETLLRGHIDF